MSYLSETAVWEPGIYQVGEEDPIRGGPPSLVGGEGFSNVASQQLANRTLWLKLQCQALLDALIADPPDDLVAELNHLVHKGTRLTAGVGLTGGGDLSSDVSFGADFATESQAEARANKVRVMSPYLSGVSLAALLGGSMGGMVPAARKLNAGDGLLGGGDLTEDRAFDVHFATTSQAKAGQAATRVMSPALAGAFLGDVDLAQELGKVPNAREINAGAGVLGGGGLGADVTLEMDFASSGEASAGTATDKVLSPALGAGALSFMAWGLGVGQTWQDVSASRVFGVSYQNTSGAPILVSCVHPNASSGGGDVTAEISENGTAWFEVVHDRDDRTITMPVSPGFYYRFTGQIPVPKLIIELR